MAQVLKEEVRQAILESAICEFMDKGYIGASMRSIALKAGISAGNMYRYFKDKQSLFEAIVDPVYTHINEHIEFEYSQLFLEINLIEYYDILYQTFSKHKSHKNELYLLLEKSKGSKYENIKETIIQRLEKAFNQMIIQEVNKDREIISGDLFSKAFATSIVEGVTKIISAEQSDAELVKNMIQFIEFVFKSTIRTMISVRDGAIKFRRLSDEEIHNNINNNCKH